jgi:hypothetical protein
MRRELKISALVIVLVSLTQFSMADIQSDEQQAELSEAKPLKVEEGATKLGEDTPKTKVEKTRSLKMEYADEEKANENMNIGKIEFLVK